MGILHFYHFYLWEEKNRFHTFALMHNHSFSTGLSSHRSPAAQHSNTKGDLIYTDFITLPNHYHNFTSFPSHLLWKLLVWWLWRASILTSQIRFFHVLPWSISLIWEITSILSHKRRCGYSISRPCFILHLSWNRAGECEGNESSLSS